MPIGQDRRPATTHGNAPASQPAEPPPPARGQVWLLGILAAAMLVPVTLPVPVLRGLVQERFGVSDFATAAFMSINMVGAFFAAPLAGAWADRFGRHKPLILLALAVDALCFLGLTRTVPFPVFLAIRLVEGCAHITALSLLLSLAARTAEAAGSGRVMGVVGAGITFGVALGAPLGGRLGRSDVLLPLYGGAVLLGLLLLATALLLRDRGSARTRPSLRTILALTRRDRALLAPLAYAFVDRFTVGFFTTVFPLYMKRVFELPVDRIGLMLGLLLGPFALLSYPFGRLAEHTSRTRLLAGGSLCYGIGVTALGAFPPGALPFLMTGLGVLSAVMFVPSLILTTDLADRSIRSTALGAFNACGSLGFVVGPLVGGAVSQWVGAWSGVRNGYAAAFGVAGVAEVVCVVLTLPVLRRLVREGRTT